jgi:hypothetical protein
VFCTTFFVKKSTVMSEQSLAIPANKKMHSTTTLRWLLLAGVLAGLLGTQPTTGQSPKATPCFEVDSVIATCSTVYLRVNFHFFVGDDCRGSFDVNNLGADWPQMGAFFEPHQPHQHGVAERMVYEMNQILASGTPQKLANGQYASALPCFPIRVVVGDVRIYCNRKFVNWQKTWNKYHDAYGQYAPPGINLYYSKSSGAENTGQAHPGGPGLVFSWFTGKNILHEIGHNLSLGHTFRYDDGCLDTPDEGVLWDKNCDGRTPRGSNEANPCHLLLGPDDDWCTGKRCSTTVDGRIVPVLSPCCHPDNLYNNVMGYSADGSAFTACQLRRMLQTLSVNSNPNFSCQWVIRIGGDCPPPAAVVGILPIEALENDCAYRVHGGASMHDSEYRWQVWREDLIETDTRHLHDSGWQVGPAGELVLSPTHADPTLRVDPGAEYRLVLTVKNDCGENHRAEKVVRIPDYACHDVP